MTTTVQAWGSLNYESADRAIIEVGSDLQLNLRRCAFIDPYALVLLACLVDQAIETGVHIGWTAPVNPEVARYLSRVGFGTLLTEAGVSTHGLHHGSETDVSDRMMELTRVSSSADVNQLCDLVANTLNLPMPRFGDVWETMGEMGNNLIEHAGTECGWIAAQRVFRGTPKDTMYWCIGDSGVGIRDSLNTSVEHNFSNDASAVQAALEYGVTSREPGRGNGLFFAGQVALDLDGSFTLRSGEARVVTDRSGTTPSTVPGVRGTIVAGRFKVQP